MSRKKKITEDLNEGYYVEAIDRTYIVCNMIEDILIEHPVFQKHPSLKEKAEKAQQLLLDAYQEIGGLTVELFGSNVTTPDNQEDTKQ
jgi:hypothetical protein